MAMSTAQTAQPRRWLVPQDVTGSCGTNRTEGRRLLVLCAALGLVFAAIGAQVVRLAIGGGETVRLSAAQPVGQNYARADILDRRGNLIATDIDAPSLFADPALVNDLDEVIDKLVALFPDLKAQDLRQALGDRTRRFAWIRRGLTPIEERRVHELGLPGLAFRREPRRAYPAGALSGHFVGLVNVDNKGLSGIERYIDEKGASELVAGPVRPRAAPVRLSIDLGAQHAVARELKDAMSRYQANAASALVMDVDSGELLAMVSLPDADPNQPGLALAPERLDKLTGGVFELGSIFKILTVALAMDDLSASPERFYDASQPLRFGRHTINDLHPLHRPLTVREILVRSSNVGSAMIALEAGRDRQRAFLDRLGLLDHIQTEAGRIAPPLVPPRWEEIETATIAYGHGLAVSPLQFATAVASLVNGGIRIRPTLLRQETQPVGEARVVSKRTSAYVRELLRAVVVDPHGTGKRADVPGYDVGGKTGTAEIPTRGGYQGDAVVSSFLAITPASAPRYLVLVSLFEPKGVSETQGKITAGLNAAPTAGRIVARVAPLLGLLPRDVTTAPHAQDHSSAGVPRSSAQ